MADQSPRSSESPKQAACLSCRKSKMKCIRRDGELACKKCLQRGSECVVPEYHIGRHKGTKNKRSGLEKAVHQIEQALLSSKTPEMQGQQSSLSRLEELLNAAQSASSPRHHDHSATSDLMPAAVVRGDCQPPTVRSTVFQGHSHTFSSSGEVHQHSRMFETSNLSVNDAENPLQLLAQTSELLPPLHRSNSSTAASRPDISYITRSGAPAYPQTFFSRFEARLDNEPELDPIELGLVTLTEAEMLFSFFYENLAHTRWGLDPVIHTTNFIRKTSNLLFTSVLAASCLFLPSTAAMSKRLSAHCQELVLYVIKGRKRSVEIVLGFMIGIPWMSFGEHWADDQTSFYLSVAISIALDLSLNKIVAGVPGSVGDAKTPRADCIDARRALDMDGYPDVETTSSFGRRLLRRRERSWLALFVLERGVCLARGRSYTLPISPLIERCDDWHISDIADNWDGNITSIAVLRRGLAILIERIRRACDSHEGAGATGTAVVEVIQRDIDGFFDDWFKTWPIQLSEKQQLPPYVEILVSHTRLSTYSSVINHPTAPVNVKHFFRAAGLSAALNVMRAAVQGEARLISMPNNTAIMISFAACFALRLSLSTMGDEGHFPLAPSVRTLIEETADALERIGSTPTHRKGASAIFASQLRRIIQAKAVAADSSGSNAACGATAQTPSTNPQQPHPPANHLTSSCEIYPNRPVAFSGMSNNQIIETVNNADLGFGDSWLDFHFDDAADLKWLEFET